MVAAILQLHSTVPATLGEEQRLIYTLGLVDQALCQHADIKAPILDPNCYGASEPHDTSLLDALIDDDAVELLPYALEALGYESDDLSASWHDRRGGLLTNGKKAKGVYYTPYDIARHMCKCSIDELGDTCGVDPTQARFADLACGTGVFALCLLSELKSRGIITDFASALDFLANRFRGYDTNAMTVVICRYCISVMLRSLYPDDFSRDQLDVVLAYSIVQIDSLADDSHRVFRIYDPQCIIGNPPYVSTLGGGNTYLDFLNAAIGAANESAVICYVLPISISCNRAKPYREMREKIALSGDWNARFEHYDRSPDSLFGDDVRTRITVLRLSRTCHGRPCYVITTGLSRWTSNSRARLFDMMPRRGTTVDSSHISEFVPKIETPIDASLYAEITKLNENTLAGMIMKRGQGTCKGYYPSIVYNWILALDHNPPSHDANGSPYVPDSLRLCSFATEDDLYYFIGVLNTVTAFWFWTVESDGFHLSTHLLKSLTLGKGRFNGDITRQISEYGRKLCGILPEHKTSSVNSGKTIVRYNHLPVLQTIYRIDSLILGELRSEVDAKHMHSWYRDYLDCERCDARLLGCFDYLKEI